MFSHPDDWSLKIIEFYISLEDLVSLASFLPYGSHKSSSDVHHQYLHFIRDDTIHTHKICWSDCVKKIFSWIISDNDSHVA